MESVRPVARRLALGAVAAVSAVALAACGGKDSESRSDGRSPSEAGSSAGASAPAGAHNAADVAFAKGMIPHHRQAVEMAELAATRASSSQVKELAAKIKKAQDPEITTLSGWLRAWGEQVPEEMAGMDHSGPSHPSDRSEHSSHSSMPGMEHSAMPGMMGAEEMAALKEKSGKGFDRSFMEMMVGHHRGAVKMAGVEKEKGAYGPAKTLADAVIKAQEAEIARMKRLLGEG
ncbi:DUF305 domain-containing protein [Streptomyces sp. NPDC048612]|uniref:DUF305 domain-containing protein n=1 Tax=Streptomyces sp. NPDC048612 TaxID=3365579 RepID=UPI00371C1122